jgi:uncharacterized membrane protein YeaQ/YmgE (transglycosylase-associated protein family)
VNIPRSLPRDDIFAPIRPLAARFWGIFIMALGVISWIILGLIAGFIGSKIVNKTGEGLILDIVLGIVGAIVGGFIVNLLGYSGVTGVNIYSIIVSILGAVIVLYVYRMVIGAR